MKVILIALFSLFATNSYAKLSIVSHDGTQAFNYQFSASDIGSSIGEVTIALLENYNVPFQGSERGINSILNSPLGLDALVVISDREMKSYGWCFSLNGQIPEVYPDELFIESVNDEIEWFWGYAHYLNGEWVSQCER